MSHQFILYVYGTGERPDGMEFAVGVMNTGRPGGDIALFVDKIDAHLYAYDKAKLMRPATVDVSILPSAKIDDNRFGWPMVLRREDWEQTKRGEIHAACPKCDSLSISQTIRPAGTGTGPGRTWRFGDPGGVEYLHCNDCGADSDRT